MENDFIDGLRAAALVAGVEHETIAMWARKYGIGHKIDGRWRIDRAGLERVLAARAQLKALKEKQP